MSLETTHSVQRHRSIDACIYMAQYVLSRGGLFMGMSAVTVVTKGEALLVVLDPFVVRGSFLGFASRLFL